MKVPRVTGGRAEVELLVFFSPYRPEQIGDMTHRDFNAKVPEMLKRLHPLEGNRRLAAEVKALKDAVVEVTRQELVDMDCGAKKS